MRPLEEFTCDYCGFIINQPSEGVLEFLSVRDDAGIKHCSEFKIVHHPGHSPAESLNDRQFCYHHHGAKTKDFDLDYIMTDSKNILSRLLPEEYGKSEQLAEIERRLTIPYYEEARAYFKRALNDGFIEDLLKKIIERYKSK